MWQAGATLHRGARASHHRGPPCCRAQAPDAQAQQLWLTGLVAPRHVGSSKTRARTRVPCIGRQILNHCATREALILFLLKFDSQLYPACCLLCSAILPKTYYLYFICICLTLKTKVGVRRKKKELVVSLLLFLYPCIL